MASLRHKLPLTFFETSLKSQTLRAHSHHTCMKTNGKKSTDFTCGDTSLPQFSCMWTSVFLHVDISFLV